MAEKLIELLPAIFSAIGALISGFAAVMLYKVTIQMNDLSKQIASRNYYTNIVNATNQINQTVLANDKNIEIIEKLGSLDPKDPVELGRKRWLLFLWLNSLQLTYIGLLDGLLDKESAESRLNQEVPILMKDKLAYELVEKRGYDRRFIEYCKKEYDNIKSTP